MDSFIDRFAQRKNAQDMIRANTMAEAAENERLSAQVAGYDAAMQEVRKLNLQNIENAEKVREVMDAALQKIAEVQVQVQKSESTVDRERELEKEAKEREAQKELLAEIAKQNAALEESLNAQKTAMEELMKASDEFNHRESVKVYRNVQAVIEEELPKQTEELKAIMAAQTDTIGVPKALLPIGMITLIAVLADIGINVAQILGVL